MSACGVSVGLVRSPPRSLASLAVSWPVWPAPWPWGAAPAQIGSCGLLLGRGRSSFALLPFSASVSLCGLLSPSVRLPWCSSSVARAAPSWLLSLPVGARLGCRPPRLRPLASVGLVPARGRLSPWPLAWGCRCSCFGARPVRLRCRLRGAAGRVSRSVIWRVPGRWRLGGGSLLSFRRSFSLFLAAGVRLARPSGLSRSVVVARRAHARACGRVSSPFRLSVGPLVGIHPLAWWPRRGFDSPVAGMARSKAEGFSA